MTTILQTERETREKLRIQHDTLLTNGNIKELLNALPHVVTILNDKQQIVYSNQVLLNQLNINDFSMLLGQRTGEAIKCIHSSECAGGCGTSESCTLCGALKAIKECVKENHKVSEECRITSRLNGSEESFDFEATASPFSWEGERYTIFSLVDISGVKRRRMLERIFFHDILNTAGNLKNLSDLLPELDDQDKVKSFLQLLKYVSNELVEEIEAQKQLTSAESGELKLRYETISSMEIINAVSEQFKITGEQTRIGIHVDPESENISFECDKSLLIRVLKNMLKNAIEASVDRKAVTIGIRQKTGRLLFYVRNKAHMTRDVQLQVFNRNFSTKATDRGLGTYSMRLLGEKYLKGNVYFETSSDRGTTFYLEVPHPV